MHPGADAKALQRCATGRHEGLSVAPRHEVTVVKIGGSVFGQDEPEHGKKLLDDIAFLHRKGHRLAIVHGGSRKITQWLDDLNISFGFQDGLRVTTPQVLDVVVAVLSLENKRLVAELQSRGVPAVGLSGADNGIISAKPISAELGRVGKVSRVDTFALLRVLEAGAVAVLTPVAIEAKRSGNGYHPGLLNVNADTAAGYVAAALKADRLILVTDTEGVRNGAGEFSQVLAPGEVKALIQAGTAKDGMIPKLESALKANQAGVETTVAPGLRANVLRSLLNSNGSRSKKPLGTTIPVS